MVELRSQDGGSWRPALPPPLGRCAALPGADRLKLLRAAAVFATVLLSTVLFLAAHGLSSTTRAFAPPHCWMRGGGGALLPPQVASLAGPDLEVVVAHYNHDLNWTAPFLSSMDVPSARLTVYSKGPSLPKGAIVLPNLGRESHTFLHHIVERYDTLADVTLLLMASAATTTKDARLRDLQAQWRRAYGAEGMACGFMDFAMPSPQFQIDKWLGTTDDARAGLTSTESRLLHGKPLTPASPRPYGAWFAEHIGGPFPQAWCPNAMLAVHRHAVLLRPRSFYRSLLTQVAASDNPEAGHYLERSFASIFGHPAALRCSGRSGCDGR